jgi:hypothetical protein
MRATAAEIAAARAAYRADDARIRAEYARQLLARCDAWCASHGGGGTRAEFFDLEHLWEMHRERLNGV